MSRQKKKKSQIRKLCVAICCLLIAFHSSNNIRRRNKLTKSALVHPKFSPWMKLLNDGDESSFLSITGFDFDAFDHLVDIFNVFMLFREAPIILKCRTEWCGVRRSYIYTTVANKQYRYPLLLRS